MAETKSGLEPNLAAALSYVFSWVTGLIFFLWESDNKYIRFHALQSIFFGIAGAIVWTAISLAVRVLAVIPFLGVIFIVLLSLLGAVYWLGFLIITVILFIRAYQGDMYKLPIIGDMAEQNA